MGTRTTYRTNLRPIAWPSKAAVALSDWMARTFLRAAMAEITRRHRMGSWEAFASFRARALHRNAEKEAAAQ